MKIWTFLTSPRPLAFAVRALILLAILPLLTLTDLFVSLAEKPLILLDAWLTHSILEVFGTETVLTGDVVRARGGSGFAIIVVSGCTGQYTILILLALMLAFPSPWLSKGLGFLIGALFISVLNLVRLVSLFYVGEIFPSIFDEMHLFVWQGITILIAVIYWYAWARRSLRDLESAGPQAAPSP